ncbi:mechanosensitive ion channel family protein [Castellaniella sp. GW247-6E4]|uniref:mechanosensitive ion channel family protein n=1 Tax=Castellaniella sp. GW247-6E4 TaxID=3140380 RepID=UPI003315A1D7
MTAYWAIFLDHLHQAWLPHYVPAMACIIVLGMTLTRVTRRALPFALRMLLLFVALVVMGAASAATGSASLAKGFSQLAVLVLGMTLIRQGGFMVFRLLVPRLGMRPPRILEELLIFLGYIVWLLLRLSAEGLDLGSLVASTAVLTAVLAFAMQDTLGNILSGLALQLDHSIHIGDWIQLDTMSGRVVEVQWRHTAVRTLFGELVLIPNSHLMKSRITLTGGPSSPARVRLVNFYCGFDMPSGRVIDEVQKALAQADLPGIAKDPAPSCIVSDFVDGMLQYTVRYLLTDPETPGTCDSLIRQHLHALFRRQGWRMAAPRRDIHRAANAAMAGEPRESDLNGLESVLAGLPLFSMLTPDERRQLAGQLRATPYATGSTIARQGEVGDCLFILVRGQVDVWLDGEDGRHPLAVLEPIQIMGEMSVLTGEPRSATLSARGEVECYALSKEAFQIMLQNRPELADSFAHLLAERNEQRSTLQQELRETRTVQRQDAILTRIRSLFRL